MQTKSCVPSTVLVTVRVATKPFLSIPNSAGSRAKKMLMWGSVLPVPFGYPGFQLVLSAFGL